MIVTPQRQPNPEPFRFCAHVIGNTISLAFLKYLLALKAEKATIAYHQYCKSPYDDSFCLSQSFSKELGQGFERTVNAVGGVFVASLLLAVTGTVAGMAYRRFSKQTTEAAKQPLLQSKAASKPTKDSDYTSSPKIKKN